MTTSVSNATEATAPSGFAALNLSEPVLRAIEEVGYTEPTPVQAATYPIAISGRDIIVQARTGTGKTAAFGIPLVDKLVTADPWVQALVLAPTRELAVQSQRELARLAQFKGLHTVAIYGGAPMGRQIEELKSGAQLVSGTPGRVLDHLRRGTLEPSRLKVLVLDEMDEMLSMGFAKELNAILEMLPPKGRRQTMCFSATVDGEIRRHAERHMHEPEMISLSSDAVSAAQITHQVYMVTGRDRISDLVRVLEVEDPDSAIVFCNMRSETERVAMGLKQAGFNADWLNGDLPQKDRERIMSSTREGKLRYLVATDVAARGIDISHLTHVINFTFPESAAVYVHRTGRTGRAGRTGCAISLVGPEELGRLYYLRLEYKISPVERSLPTHGELKTRQEIDRIGLLEAAFADRPNPNDLSVARRLLTHPENERILAGLLHTFFGTKEDVDDEAAAARRSKPGPDLEVAARAGRERENFAGRQPDDRPRSRDRDRHRDSARPPRELDRSRDVRDREGTRDLRDREGSRDSRDREGSRDVRDREGTRGEPRVREGSRDLRDREGSRGEPRVREGSRGEPRELEGSRDLRDREGSGEARDREGSRDSRDPSRESRDRSRGMRDRNREGSREPRGRENVGESRDRASGREAPDRGSNRESGREPRERENASGELQEQNREAGAEPQDRERMREPRRDRGGAASEREPARELSGRGGETSGEPRDRDHTRELRSDRGGAPSERDRTREPRDRSSETTGEPSDRDRVREQRSGRDRSGAVGGEARERGRLPSDRGDASAELQDRERSEVSGEPRVRDGARGLRERSEPGSEARDRGRRRSGRDAESGPEAERGDPSVEGADVESQQRSDGEPGSGQTRELGESGRSGEREGRSQRARGRDRGHDKRDERGPRARSTGVSQPERDKRPQGESGDEGNLFNASQAHNPSDEESAPDERPRSRERSQARDVDGELFSAASDNDTGSESAETSAAKRERSEGATEDAPASSGRRRRKRSRDRGRERAGESSQPTAADDASQLLAAGDARDDSATDEGPRSAERGQRSRKSSASAEPKPLIAVDGELLPADANGADQGEHEPTEPLEGLLYLNLGKRDGVRVPEVARLLRDSCELTRGQIGRIRVRDRYTFVDVPEGRLDGIIATLNGQVLHDKPLAPERAKTAKN